MTAATADRATSSRVGSTRYLSLATAAVLLAGCMVAVNASGEAIDGAPAADVQFAGIAREGVDQSDGDEGVNVYVEGEFLLAGSGWAAGDEGQDAYMLDNQTVVPASDATLSHWVRVGRVVQVVSATQVWVRIEPLQPQRAQLYTGTVAGTNAAALDLTDLAAVYGGSDFYVQAVLSAEAFVTATAAHDGLRVVTTDFTVADGAIETVADETANTWLISFLAILQ